MLSLQAVDHRLRKSGWPDNPDHRAEALLAWLHELVTLALAASRGDPENGRMPALTATGSATADDFAAGDGDREAWSTLEARYFSGQESSLDTIAMRVGLSRRTLRRRQSRGYVLLAAALRRQEASARSARPRPSEPELPPIVGRFIGRERELAMVRNLMAAHRLVTIVGIGGIGKSRLAIEVLRDLAKDFAEGTHRVELVTVATGERLSRALASSFGLREQAGKSATELLIDHLTDRHILLLLDNCEHLPEAVAKLADRLLQACSRLQLIATSRRVLELADATNWRLSGLQTPEDGARITPERLVYFDAPRLFVDRARRSRPDFRPDLAAAEAVASICRRLEGIPLSIELVAARLRHLDLEQVAARLEDHALWPAGDGRLRPQHATLRASLRWSIDLLEPGEARLLGRLSVFSGSWDSLAAAAVCADTGLNATSIPNLLRRLVGHSLVEPIGGNLQARWRLLEPVRLFVLEGLERSPDSARLRDRHLEHYRSLAETAQDGLRGPEQLSWIERLEVEEGNLQAAARWALASNNPQVGLRLAAAMARYWYIRGRYTEGLAELSLQLDSPTAGDENSTRANALAWAGGLAALGHEKQRAATLLEEAQSMAERLGDRANEALALHGLATLAFRHGDVLAAQLRLERCIAIRLEHGDQPGQLDSMKNLSVMLKIGGQRERARQNVEACLILARKLGDRHAVADCLEHRASLDMDDRAFERATAGYLEALAIKQALGDRQGQAILLLNMGIAPLHQGDPAAARRSFEASLAIWRDLGHRNGEALLLHAMAEAEIAEGRAEAAQQNLWAGLRLRRELNAASDFPHSLQIAAQIAVYLERPARALRLLGACRSLSRQQGWAISPLAEAEMAEVEARARAALTELEVAQALTEGEGLDSDRAVAYALAEVSWAMLASSRASTGSEPTP
jgi:predicted ATPase